MKICFWGDIARALKGNTSGGGELQIALLAKALAKGGNEVVIIDYEASNDFITEEGIKLFKVKGWNDGIRFFRIFTHRLPQLYLSLKNQKADIYYCRMRDFTHILAFWAARRAKAKFILAMASDLDTQSFAMRLKYYYIPNFGLGGGLWWFFNGILNETIQPWLLRKSDIIFVQHEGQKQILRRKHIKSLIFPNLLELSRMPIISQSVSNDFIYVGSLDKRKGFTEFFELVKKTPLQSFKVVGQPRDNTGYFYYDKLKSFENVTLLGQLSYLETQYQIANSKALISTSRMEGFPNVFIEAWACGIPVLSLYFDPGGVIKKEGLGEVADGNLDILLKAMTVTADRDKFSKKAKAYVDRNHVLNEARITRICNLFNEIKEEGEIR